MEAEQSGGLRHWCQETDAGGICWLRFDKADSSANTLSQAAVLELDSILEGLMSRAMPRGIVIISAKDEGFVLGADVEEFQQVASAEDGTRFSAQGQRTLQRLESIACPTVAAINGFALGGGLELALACDYRVVVRGYDRTLGVPEVQLGIHPGFGGTARLVRIVGAQSALEMMLSGRSLSPIEAAAIGLVDRLVAREELEQSAREIIETRPAPHRPAWRLRLVNTALIRPLLCLGVQRGLRAKVRANRYPAPYAILELYRRFGGKGDAAFRAEAQSIGNLLCSRTSRNLVRLFVLRERLRRLGSKTARSARVHVVGAGVMGGDIAAWCALRELSVGLQDRAREYVEPALERARALFGKRLKAPGAAQAAADRLNVDLEASRIAEADVVIEAIAENLDAKVGLLSGLEPRLKKDAIIATNTSSIPLEQIAKGLARPNRLVGLHFFNPVAKLPLVEVIRGDDTDDDTFQRALDFVVQIGKVPLPCKSAPGFVVNRVLMPYMLEALYAHQEGYAFETIDAAAKAFGMPVGPIELADRVGLDVALHVARILTAVSGGQPPQVLGDKVTAGELGAKTGSGFYRYHDGHPDKNAEYPPPDSELQDRLILPMVNEALACHADGVIDDLDLLDVGVVLGTGFAPFIGGPVRYARERGVDEVIARLEALAEKHGARFAPSPGWSALGGRSLKSDRPPGSTRP